MKMTLRFAVLSWLLITLLAAPAGFVPISLAAPAAEGSISGVVFFDANGNGVRDAGEPGLPGVTVTVTGGSFTGATTTDLTGAYTVTGLTAGTYTVTETDPAGYVSTTANTLSVSVSTTVVTGIDFGDLLPMTLSGVVFVENDGIAGQGLGEPGIPDALVDVIADTDGNGQVDIGEPALGSDVTDDFGGYSISGLLPGLRVIRVLLPVGGSSGSDQTPLELISTQVSGQRDLNFSLPPLAGQVWNDTDGDETIDADEALQTGVRLTLSWGPPGEIISSTITTDDRGNYRWSALPAGNYVLVVDPYSLPPTWTPSFDATDLVFSLAPADGQVKRLNLGYYDPLTVAPLRIAEWKKELKQAGKPHYTPAELNTFIAAVVTASPLVFSETISVTNALTAGANTPEEKARKQWAAVRLNLASARLLPKTPVNLPPTLTTAKTIGDVVSQVEGLLYPPSRKLKADYDRVEKIADSLNNGKGIGYGLQGKSSLAKGAYRSTDVTSALKSGGSLVDTYMDGAIMLSKWSAGSLDPGLNVFRPQLRVFVQVFYNGATLEVLQKLSNGATVSLGTATPAYWNKDVKTYYTFDLWRVASLGELASTDLLIYVRDPDNDGGPSEHVKVDSAELVFGY